MRVEVFASAGEYYIRLPGGSGALRWHWQGDHWTSCRARVPADASATELDVLPSDLREEVLAFLARSEALGNRAWSS
ncbi:MAG: hypothetical protein AB1505_18040 [Candidatus Latescibacterota bacterium]